MDEMRAAGSGATLGRGRWAVSGPALSIAAVLATLAEIQPPLTPAQESSLRGGASPSDVLTPAQKRHLLQRQIDQGEALQRELGASAPPYLADQLQFLRDTLRMMD